MKEQLIKFTYYSNTIVSGGIFLDKTIEGEGKILELVSSGEKYGMRGTRKNPDKQEYGRIPNTFKVEIVKSNDESEYGQGVILHLYDEEITLDAVVLLPNGYWLCPYCKSEFNTWSERCDCVITEYTFDANGNISEENQDFRGDSTIICPGCREDLADFGEITFQDLQEHIKKAQDPKGKRWGVKKGDKVRAKWFDNPNWFYGIVESNEEGELFIPSKDTGIHLGLGDADEVVKEE